MQSLIEPMNNFEHTIFNLLPENIYHIASYLSNIHEIHNLFNVSETMKIFMKNKVKELWGLGNIILYPFQIEFVNRCMITMKHKDIFISDDCCQYKPDYCISANNATIIKPEENSASCNCFELYKNNSIKKYEQSKTYRHFINKTVYNTCDNTTTRFQPPTTLYIEHGKRVTILAVINRLKKIDPSLNIALLITEDETRLKWKNDIELCGLSHMFSDNISDIDKGLTYYGYDDGKMRENLEAFFCQSNNSLTNSLIYKMEDVCYASETDPDEDLNSCRSDLPPVEEGQTLKSSDLFL